MTYIAEVVDLFCGIGGLSHGFKRAGFRVVGGFDVDQTCKFAFEHNNEAKLNVADVAELTAADIHSCFTGKLPTVLAGCAPCQPFSKYKNRYGEDPRWNLVSRFADLAAEVFPDFVTMENVPQLLKYQDGHVFQYLCNRLKSSGYSVWFNVENATNYGVPQNRERLVLLARKGGDIAFPVRTSQTTNVRDAISHFPCLNAGETDENDPMHKCSMLSSKNLKRIRASIPGGTWKDWPENLITDCHKRKSGQSYGSVYGRMSWDKPSPTMTTQCYGFGNGRFGHPDQDRAISLREAASLQSFPPDYQFVKQGEAVTMKTGGRWIGNAVPVKLAEGIGHGVRVSINGG
ncbi:MAG: DNA cytosine methyltransferase [Pseudomonadota bacterium]